MPTADNTAEHRFVLIPKLQELLLIITILQSQFLFGYPMKTNEIQ